MKIIFISDFLFIESSGAKTLAWAHKKTLESLYGMDNVHTIALVGKKTGIKPDDNMLCISGPKSNIELGIKTMCGYTTYLDQKGVSKIVSIINDISCDLVFIDNSIYGKLVSALKNKYPNLPIVAFYHDVKAYLAKEWMDKVSILKKSVYRAMICGEKTTANMVNANIVLNEREANRFINSYSKKPEILLPIYCHIEEPTRFENKLDEKLNLLFVGGYYGPNVEGIEWFINTVFTHLPISTNLTIAGKNMGKLRNKYDEYKNITVYDYVESLSDLYNKADIVIGPIFSGAGMKVKTMEAMAFGKIIIATDESFEGYTGNIAKEYWEKYMYRANTENEFIEAIENINKQRNDLKKYNRVVRRIYEEYYSEKMAEKILSENLSNLICGSN